MSTYPFVTRLINAMMTGVAVLVLVVLVAVRFDGSVVLLVVVRGQPDFPAVAPHRGPVVPGHWRRRLRPP